MATHRNDVKRVRFFRDGDANFSGVNLAVSKRKYRCFDALLSDLTRKVPLPFGVRTLHTPGGIHHVCGIDDIEDGKSYVCSTFNSRPIKKLDYMRTLNRPAWHSTKRSDGMTPRKERETESNQTLLRVGNLKPKSITVVSKDDSSNRARIVLNRRTAMSFEGLLQTVSDVLQLNNGPVKDLYTINGKKINGLADLINGPDMILASGRSSGSISTRSLPSRLLKKRNHTKSNSLPASSTTDETKQKKPRKNFAKPSPYLQSQLGSQNKKVKGNTFVFTVKTSDIEDAGTRSKVSVVVYGTKGKSSKLILRNPGSSKFEPGSRKEFEHDVGNIGKIYKMRVTHEENEDDDESTASWHLSEIIMTSVSNKKEEYVFQCNKWFSNSEEDFISIREIAAIKNGKPLGEVVSYEITVITGDILTAGTESNVFINIFGEKGDTGKRWLTKSINTELPFERGNVDVFEIEAVSLGNLKRLLIGHDNNGDAAGWYLDKVLIKDIAMDMEYSFPCRRWLDEDEEDGRTELVLKASPISETYQSPKKLWSRNAWKFQDSNEITLISITNDEALKVDADERVFCTGKFDGDCSVFVISEGGEEKSIILSVKADGNKFYLTLDDERVTATQGNPGLLSEFYVQVQQDNTIKLESVVHKGSFVSVSESGDVSVSKEDEDKQNTFHAIVKGTLRSLGRIKMRPSGKSYTVIDSNGFLYGDGDSNDEGAEFVVHKTGNGSRAFQSAASDKFIRVTAQGIDCRGDDKSNDECKFTIHRDKETGNVRLESVKMVGVFLGIGQHGRVKHAVDAGDETTVLSLQVVSFGDKKIQMNIPSVNENYDYEDGFDEDSNGDSSSSSDSETSEREDKDQESRPASRYSGKDSHRSSAGSGAMSEMEGSGSRQSRPASKDREERPDTQDSDEAAEKEKRQSSTGMISRTSTANAEDHESDNERENKRLESPEAKDNDQTENREKNPENKDESSSASTPVNSRDSNSRPQTANTREVLEQAQRKLENSESQMKDDGADKEESTASKSSSRNSSSKAKGSEQDSNNGDNVMTNAERGSASNSSRNGSSRSTSSRRPASQKSETGRTSSEKGKDSTYEGLVRDTSRPVSRSGSAASNLSRSRSQSGRSSSKRSQAVNGAIMEQTIEEKKDDVKDIEKAPGDAVNENTDDTEQGSGDGTEDQQKTKEETDSNIANNDGENHNGGEGNNGEGTDSEEKNNNENKESNDEQNIRRESTDGENVGKQNNDEEDNSEQNDGEPDNGEQNNDEERNVKENIGKESFDGENSGKENNDEEDNDEKNGGEPGNGEQNNDGENDLEDNFAKENLDGKNNDKQNNDEEDNGEENSGEQINDKGDNEEMNDRKTSAEGTADTPSHGTPQPEVATSNAGHEDEERNATAEKIEGEEVKSDQDASENPPQEGVDDVPGAQSEGAANDETTEGNANGAQEMETEGDEDKANVQLKDTDGDGDQVAPDAEIKESDAMENQNASDKPLEKEEGEGDQVLPEAELKETEAQNVDDAQLQQTESDGSRDAPNAESNPPISRPTSKGSEANEKDIDNTEKVSDTLENEDCKERIPISPTPPKQPRDPTTPRRSISRISNSSESKVRSRPSSASPGLATGSASKLDDVPTKQDNEDSVRNDEIQGDRANGNNENAEKNRSPDNINEPGANTNENNENVSLENPINDADRSETQSSMRNEDDGNNPEEGDKTEANETEAASETGQPDNAEDTEGKENDLNDTDTAGAEEEHAEEMADINNKAENDHKQNGTNDSEGNDDTHVRTEKDGKNDEGESLNGVEEGQNMDAANKNEQDKDNSHADEGDMNTDRKEVNESKNQEEENGDGRNDEDLKEESEQNSENDAEKEKGENVGNGNGGDGGDGGAEKDVNEEDSENKNSNEVKENEELSKEAEKSGDNVTNDDGEAESGTANNTDEEIKEEEIEKKKEENDEDNDNKDDDKDAKTKDEKEDDKAESANKEDKERDDSKNVLEEGSNMEADETPENVEKNEQEDVSQPDSEKNNTNEDNGNEETEKSGKEDVSEEHSNNTEENNANNQDTQSTE